MSVYFTEIWRCSQYNSTLGPRISPVIFQDKNLMLVLLLQKDENSPKIRIISVFLVKGFESHEVCRMLGVSQANQRVLLHRARTKVRQALAPYMDEITILGQVLQNHIQILEKDGQLIIYVWMGMLEQPPGKYSLAAGFVEKAEKRRRKGLPGNPMPEFDVPGGAPVFHDGLNHNWHVMPFRVVDVHPPGLSYGSHQDEIVLNWILKKSAVGATIV